MNKEEEQQEEKRMMMWMMIETTKNPTQQKRGRRSQHNMKQNAQKSEEAMKGKPLQELKYPQEDSKFLG